MDYFSILFKELGIAPYIHADLIKRVVGQGREARHNERRLLDALFLTNWNFATFKE